MMSTDKYRWISLLFLLVIASIAVYFNINKPRIMILHSYHPDYAWTRDVNIGIRRIADDWGRYSVIWHYMDTKKHRDQHWQKQASLLARRAVETTEPDVLIIIDDLGQKLVGKHYVNHPSINIVFAGVNGSVAPYGYEGAKNVTGIFERKQLKAIKETLLTLEQQRTEPREHPRVGYLIDKSTSLKQGLPYFNAFDWGPLDFQGAITADSFEQWKQEIKNICKTADYLLIANYRKLVTSVNNSKTPLPKEVMSWTERHSPIPVIGVNVFNTEEGAMISVGVSPYEQGETAAKIAERIIEEKIAAGTIPMIKNKQYVVALNETALEKRHIVMPSIYEAFGRATENYYENEKPY